jgi:hypothetical protein
MALGQHEPSAIGPHRIVRIKAQKMLPQRVSRRRERRRRAGVAGVGPLNRIRRKGANGVDAEFVQSAIRLDVRLRN